MVTEKLIRPLVRSPKNVIGTRIDTVNVDRRPRTEFPLVQKLAVFVKPLQAAFGAVVDVHATRGRIDRRDHAYQGSFGLTRLHRRARPRSADPRTRCVWRAVASLASDVDVPGGDEIHGSGIRLRRHSEILRQPPCFVSASSRTSKGMR